MSKNAKKDKKHPISTEKVLLITAIIQLIEALISLINKLLE